jgi:superoxide dismutase, Fe-Mn family
MPHEPKDFRRLISECRGFLSEKQLEAHFTLYQGYVKKLNEIETALKTADTSKANYSFSEYSELRRREPVAYNGTVLHELYFENLGAKGIEVTPAFKKEAVRAHGNWEAAVRDLKAMAASAHGWVLVTYDWNFGVVRHNLVQSEHHVGLLPNQTVLVAIDCWEHAYFADYQTNKEEYLDGLFAHINWGPVAARLALTPAGGGGKMTRDEKPGGREPGSKT